VVESPIPVPEAGASQASDLSGEMGVMHDASHLYLATTLQLDQSRLHAGWWEVLAMILFTDEGNALDGQWAAPDCGPPLPGEGWVVAYEDAIAPDSFDWFERDSRAGACGHQPSMGVRWATEVDGSVVFGYSLDLNRSELDDVGPGDCFHLGLWTYAVGYERGSGRAGEGDWLVGMAPWPGSSMYIPDTFGMVCLDPCEVDFVPRAGLDSAPGERSCWFGGIRHISLENERVDDRSESSLFTGRTRVGRPSSVCVGGTTGAPS